jgi:prevent-host-death family protein
MKETHVSIGEVKARLSEYVRRARAGEGVVITDRGRPVARLGPLAGAGLVRAPERGLDPGFLDAPRPADPEGRSLAVVLEERAEGR